MITAPAQTEPPRCFPFPIPDDLDPIPELAELRRCEPISRIRLPSGDLAWLVTRYADVQAVLVDSRFSRALAAAPGGPRLAAEPTLPSSILAADPPVHTRLRKLVAPAFTIRRTEQIRPFITGLVDQLVTALETVDDDPVDLMASFVQPLAVGAICEFLGVSNINRSQFQLWAESLTTVTTRSADLIRETIREITAYLRTLLVAKRAARSNDLIGKLIVSCDQDHQLNEEELFAFVLTLLFTGYQTTADRLGGIIYTLLTHPSQLDWLRTNLDDIPEATEELLRHVQGSVTQNMRVATEDVELNGRTIHKGEAVMVSIASANRDEYVFPHADRLDLTRTTNPHLAFGHGIHHCLGAQLARIELQAALAGLLRRCPHLRLAEPEHPPTWKTGLTIRAPRSLPVRLRP